MIILKHIVRGILYVGVIIVGPFMMVYNKMKKRKASVKYTNIVDGFANYTFPNKYVEEVATTRAAICSRCPYAKSSGTIKTIMVDNKTKEISGMYCDVCGCSLSAKVRSNDYCPKGKW